MYPRHSYCSLKPTVGMSSIFWFLAMMACAPPDGEIAGADEPPGPGPGAAAAEVSGATPGATIDLAVARRAQPGSAAAGSSFTAFESGQVRPLALSPDRQHLFAVNTPDNRLEIFRIQGNRLVHTQSIPVGLEPVAVAARSEREVWVVNHLSDSVSVIELDAASGSGRVVRTLLVGDEPRDIAFAGPQRRRAFITTAHRGQNIPFDPQLTTPGVGRADVWVFDAGALGTSLGGTPLTIVTLFADTPRALAVTPDGARVYAAGFHTGNQTTTVSEFSIPDGFGPDGVSGPATNFEGEPAPEVAQIAKWNGSHWVDAGGRARDAFVKFSLPDKDVFVLDAMADPPRQLAGPAGFFQHVGTILYSMVVNPASGKVYVANTDANNLERFEGPGIFAGHSLRGHLHENRITVLTPWPWPRRRRRAAPPQQAHRLQQVLRADAQRRERALAGPAAGHGGDPRRGDAVCRGAGLRQDRRVLDRRAGERHVRAQRGQPRPRLGRRADRGRARRGPPAAVRADPVRRRDLGDRHREADRGRARRDAQPRAAERRGRPPVPVRRVVLVEPRRLVVRELPRVRRLRLPGVGSRQPRRAR